MISVFDSKSVVGIMGTSSATAFLCIYQYGIDGHGIDFPFPPTTFFAASIINSAFLFEHDALAVYLPRRSLDKL
ncbi:hypothetical protein D3C73_1551370 [compost metagenome]